MARQEYYSDGVTRITDPFYLCICRKCIKAFWAISVDTVCPECGSDELFRTFDKEEFDRELKKLKDEV